jgi:hypothetical protein
MTSLDPQFDINEVKMLWPAFAEEIMVLRKLNPDAALKSHENIKKTQGAQKMKNKVYWKYIMRDYCFYNFVSYLHREEN